MQVKSYQDLIAWQKAISLVTEIYRLTAQFPGHEIYGLTSQFGGPPYPSRVISPRAMAAPRGENSSSFSVTRAARCARYRPKSLSRKDSGTFLRSGNTLSSP